MRKQEQSEILDKGSINRELEQVLRGFVESIRGKAIAKGALRMDSDELNALLDRAERLVALQVTDKAVKNG